jgi:membrane fusion protein (multidrug efflux system)
MFKNYFLYLLALATAAASCGNKSAKKEDKGKSSGPVAVDVSIAKASELSNIVEANGTVLALDFVELKSEVPGRIVFLNIKEGALVTEGTVLVKLNDEDLQAQLRKYNAQLDLAKTNEKRLRALLDVKGLNVAEYDQAVNQVNNIEADIAYTNALIRKTEIKAPFTGVIGLRNVSKGAFVSSQDIMATMQSVNSMKVDFVLPETYSGSIYNGLKVEVVNDVGKKYPATVIGIEPQVNTATRNIKIRAVVSGDNKGLNPGAFVRVLFNEGETKKRIVLPSNCIIPETRFKKVAVIKNGKVKMTNVETGLRKEAFVEIISGIEEGDTFAVNGLLYLKPDAEVIIRNIK